MKGNTILHIPRILVLIGAINLGFIGVSKIIGEEVNPIDWIFFSIGAPVLSSVLYILIGISAFVWVITKNNF